MESIESLNVSSKGISDLTGIESFTSLISLSCSKNQLTYLNLSSNLSLKILACFENQLSSLDVSNNASLESLSCSTNKLETLNVNNNTKLNKLICAANQLTNLDVSQNTLLNGLTCAENELTNLDITQNTLLTVLWCWENQLTGLNLSNNTNLTDLNCSDNRLRTLDLSNNTLLTSLVCWANTLTALDLSNNVALEYLSCELNFLSDLDLSNNAILQLVYCSHNRLTNLDFSNNNALFHLDCSFNELTNLDLRNGNNTYLNYFAASSNPELTCITVDDATYSTTNWTNIDAQTSFSENCSILWSSNLDNTSNFTTVDLDADTVNWTVEGGTPSKNSANKGITSSGTRFFSQSWDSGFGNLNPDNLLITPAGEITIPASATSISFKLNVEASSSERPAENFAIYIFDEAVGQSFDTKIHEETLTIGGTGTAKDIIASIPTSFAGKTIGIIVRHYNTTGQDKLYVDDFEVSYEASTLSIEEKSTQLLTLYPNPTNDKIHINTNQKGLYALSNINGQVLIKGTFIKGENSINLAEFQNGLYFLNIKSESGFITKKIIKQ